MELYTTISTMYSCQLNLVQKGSSSEHHGELTGVVGVVEPAGVTDVPCMKPTGKTNNAIPSLPPHPEGGPTFNRQVTR